MAADLEELGRAQRKYTRYKVSIPVKVTLADDGHVATFHGTGSNVSEAGMRVFIPREFDVSRLILLELRLPYYEERLKLRAVVRNREGFEYGVEFVNPSEHHRHVIVRNCSVLTLLR